MGEQHTEQEKISANRLIRHLHLQHKRNSYNSTVKRQMTQSKIKDLGTSLVVQWLRLPVLNEGGPVHPLARELDPTGCNKEPTCHN